MAKNLLTEGETRVGFLEVDDESIPLLPARLDREPDQILLTVPYVWGGEATDKLERWFNGSFHWADDPDQTNYQYEPPTELDFRDRDGSVALIGCRSVGGTIMSVINEGRVSVRFAVLGGRNAASYRKINGLRSEVEGLGTWMNLRSVQVAHEFDDESRLLSATLQLKSPDDVPVARDLNLRICPAFQFGPGEKPDETVVTERMFIESDVRSAREWTDHLELHIAVRDLVRVASWRGLNFLKHEVTRDDDPIRTLDGSTHGKQWLPAETLATGATDTPTKVQRLDYLFTFDSIGRQGVGRWIRLRGDWSRAISPVLGLLNLKKASLAVHFAQLCIGLEALGYLLAIEDGVAPSAAGRHTFRARLERIVTHLKYPLEFDSADWIDAATNSYRQVKHADNPEPDQAEMFLAYYRGIHVFRAWIAGKLGVSAASYAHGQQLDRIARQANRN